MPSTQFASAPEPGDRIGVSGAAATLGLVLAGIVIGSLGVLDDLTVSQSSTVLAGQGTRFLHAVAFEQVAGVIVATVVGSIGLLAAVPLTTGLAAVLAARDPR